MKLKIAVFAVSLTVALFGDPVSAADYVGVDEAVVEKFAANAGRRPTPPLLNADNGDLGLFLFLTAGAIGGFVCGYCFRSLYSRENK